MKKIYILILMLAVSSYSFAALKTWIGASGGTWSLGTNWDGGVPGATDDVLFNTSVTVIVDGAKNINSLSLTSNAVVNLRGNNSTTIINIGGPVISLIDAGCTLTLTGTANSNKCEISMNSSSSATLSINGILNIGDVTTYTGASRLVCALGSNVNVNGALNYVGTAATIAGSSSTNFSVSAGGMLEMKRTSGGQFPVGTYAPTARLIISGVSVATYPTFTSSQTTTWGTIEFDAPNNIATGSAGSSMFSSPTAICQSFKVLNTGTGNATFASSGSAARVMTVLGNLEVSAGAILNINSTIAGANATASGFAVAGDIIVDGTVTETGSATGSFIEMNSANPQNISIASITQEVSLRMNGAGLKTALSNLTLPNSPNAKLVFTSGNLDVASNNKTLFIQNDRTDACLTGTASSHLIGKMKRNTNFIGSYHFPVSNNATDIPKCYVTTDAVGASDFTVEFIDANPNKNSGLTSGVIDQVANYVWDIQRAAGGPTASVSLGYGGKAGNNIATPSTAKVVHWNGSTWEDKGGTQDVLSPSIDAIASDIGLNDFSPYSIGGPVGVLPVRVEYLRGASDGKNNTLNWKVDCTTDPSLTIILQRSSDGINFTTIQSQVANNVRCEQPFSYADNNPNAGKNFYRLKIIQIDGAVRYSTIVVLTATGKTFTVANVYPMPMQNTAVVNVQTQFAGNVTLTIVDMQGRTVQSSLVTVQAGENNLPLQASKLSAGAYILKVTTSTGDTQSVKIVKQ